MGIRMQIADICLHMGGGIEYNTAWGLSYQDREIAVSAINKKIKAENPKGKDYM